MTNAATSVPRSSTGTYVSLGVEVTEGKILNRKYTVVDDSAQRFIIPNANVDTSTITVKVQKSISDSEVFTYTNGDAVDVTTIKGTDKVYFLQEIEEEKYEITFGDGTVGKQLSTANIVFIEYIVSNGTLANKASSFTPVATVADLSIGSGTPGFDLTTNTNANGGADLQTTSSIQFQAPKLYQAQKRATTKNDYKAIILEQRPDIESITVYGGEDADPVQYGKVFIGVKPIGNNTFSIQAKDSIKNDILKKVNVVTVTPEIVDPVFYYLIVESTVNYDPVTNLTNESTLKTNINTSITNYITTNLKKFDQKFRYSKLVQDIDNTSDAIRNNKTTIKYQQRITPATLNVAENHNIFFSNVLEKGSVSSTSFVGTDGNTYSLTDDSLGKIKASRTTSGVVDSPKLYLIQTDGSTDQGTIDYTTGKIVLTNFTPVTISDSTVSIRLNVTPEINNSDITPLREQILTYDSTDSTSITINMVAETII